ncbi:hypothetical protein PV04_06123 [Phialophora macrospora]|uniref:Uncharacterized protein n=1 Tax=Phialophora macrospora TaxID=1851006 RepID=A0A0D2G425_9EURO|nr:hypothetical protein PV04_06123 [Phialophora macrospora]
MYSTVHGTLIHAPWVNSRCVCICDQASKSMARSICTCLLRLSFTAQGSWTTLPFLPSSSCHERHSATTFLKELGYPWPTTSAPSRYCTLHPVLVHPAPSMHGIGTALSLLFVNSISGQG